MMKPYLFILMALAVMITIIVPVSATTIAFNPASVTQPGSGVDFNYTVFTSGLANTSYIIANISYSRLDLIPATVYKNNTQLAAITTTIVDATPTLSFLIINATNTTGAFSSGVSLEALADIEWDYYNTTHANTDNVVFDASLTQWHGTAGTIDAGYHTFDTLTNGAITGTLASGFTQHDDLLDPQFTVTLNIVDATTTLPIPVVLVLDNTGKNQTTSTGTFVGTYPYSVVVLYLSSPGYNSRAVSYVVDQNIVETVQLTKTVTSTTEGKLNILYPHEVRIIVIDAKGVQQDNVLCTAVMMNSTIEGTNWLSTLFGVSEAATPVNDTLMTGYTDSMGTVVFPMVSSGLYTLTFTDTGRGIATTKTLHPQENTYTFIVPTTRTAPVESSASSINSSVTVVDIAGAVYLNVSYANAKLTTTNVHYFINYANTTPFYEKNFAGTPSTNQTVNFGYPVSNVRGDAYFWGFEAYDTKWGWTNQSSGITMKGVDGMLYNPFIYSDGW
jgi:hypothetical protein